MKKKLDPQKINWRQVKRFSFFCLALLILVILFSYIFKALIIPICLSLFLTYLLAPLVKSLSGYRINRTAIISFILLLTLGLIGLALIVAVPMLYNETLDLLRLTPKVYEIFMKQWLPPIQDILFTWDIISPEELDKLIRESKNLSNISERITQALTTIWNTAPQLLSLILNTLMVPFLTFFMLVYSEVIKKQFFLLTPKDLKAPLKLFGARLSRSIRAVLKGQILVALSVSLLYIVGLSIIGFRASVSIGIIAGIARLIPYLDIFVGGFLCLVVIASDFQGPAQIIGVASVFLAVQSIDGMFITPRIIGDSIGLHPVVVIVTIISFADLLGFWGVILAIPTLATAKVTWQSIRPFYLSSRAYLGNRSK
jgi:predicted PurR-regulated permease PerM